jgi:hypothetical protein
MVLSGERKPIKERTSMNGYAISSPQVLTAERAKILFPEAYKTWMQQEQDNYYPPGENETGEWPGYGEEAAESDFCHCFKHIIDDRGVYCMIAPPGDFSIEWCPWEKNGSYPLGMWFFLASYEDTCGIVMDREAYELNEANAGLVKGKSVR